MKTEFAHTWLQDLLRPVSGLVKIGKDLLRRQAKRFIQISYKIAVGIGFETNGKIRLFCRRKRFEGLLQLTKSVPQKIINHEKSTQLVTLPI